MTVKDMIKELENYDENMLLYIPVFPIEYEKDDSLLCGVDGIDITQLKDGEIIVIRSCDTSTE